MDFGTILVRQNSMANQSFTAPPADVKPFKVIDTSGEYILPVPFKQAQSQLLDAIISSHYSELLAYFSDEQHPDAARAERALGSLRQMAENIESICVHPALLINHFMPTNLIGKDTPITLEHSSGMLEALGMLVRLCSELNLQIGVVAMAGPTTDIVEAYLLDKPVNCYRYSGQPLRAPRPQRPNLSTIYLVPSKIEDLTAAVNSAFDVMVAVDDSFDLTSDYATGLRSQLRDPLVRKPMAPVVTLVPLNTIIHATLSSPADTGLNALAAAVVLRDKAGQIPSELAQIYEYDLMPLGIWFRDPEGPWILPRTTQLPRFASKDVYTALMQTPSVPSQQSVDSAGPNDVKRVKLENGNNNTSFSGPVPDNDNGFTAKLLESYQKLVASVSHTEKELDNLRGTASRRENMLDEAREEILKLTVELKSKQNLRETNDSKVLRYQADTKAAQEREAALVQKVEEIERTLADKDKDSIERKYLDACKRVETLTEESETGKKKLKTQDTMIEALKAEFAQASQTIVELNTSLTELKEQANQYKEQAAGQFVRLRELAAESEEQSKNTEIAQLKAEIENLKAAMSIVDTERAVSTRDRSRYSNRSGGQNRPKGQVYSPAP